jgi:hypothetical protein
MADAADSGCVFHAGVRVRNKSGWFEQVPPAV